MSRATAGRPPGFVVALSLIGCWSACAGPAENTPPPGSGPRPPLDSDWPGLALFAAIPDDASATLWVNYQALRGTSEGQALFAAGDAAPTLRARQGFAEADDVDLSLQAALPSSGEASAPAQLAIHEGRFDPGQISRAELATGGLSRDGRHDWYRDRPLWGNQARSVALLSDTRLATGEDAIVRAAIDCDKGVSASLADADWFAEVQAALTQRWPAGEPILIDVRARLTEDVRQRIEPAFAQAGRLEWFGLRAGGREGLRVWLVARGHDEDDARAVFAGIRRAIEDALGLPVAQKLGLGRLTEYLGLGVRGHDVLLSLRIPAAAWNPTRARIGEILEILRRHD